VIVVSIILTFFYVLLNNISLWISVDFIRELFSPENVQTEQVTSVEPIKPSEDEKGNLQKMFNLNSKLDIYSKINNYIKSVIIKDNRYDTLIVVCIVIFLSFLLKNIIQYTRRVILNYIEINIVVNIRNQLHEKLLYLPLSFFAKRHSGRLTSIVFNDVNAINVALNNSFGKMILSPVQILTNVFILVIISWKLSLIMLFVLPLISYVIVKIGQGMRRRSRRVFKQIANVVAVFQEAVSAVSIVKAFTNEEKEVSKFKAANREFFKKTFRANKLRYATSPINEILLVLTLVFLLWYGGNLVYSNSGLTAEDFIRFLVFLFTMFQPIKDFSGINNTIQTGLAAAERIFDVLETDQEIYEKPGAVYLDEFNHNIKYEKVYFKYNNNESYVLDDINLNINKGEMVAFVGHSGAGKTTMANLLPRFYEINTGKISIDGIDIRDMTLHSLRHKMSIVTQDTILFNDTIRMNIAYGSENVIEQNVIDAAKAANAWEFIKKMENGLDTQIGEKGTRLSGGQKQRLSIARAILRNPSILILDEATSSLDTESERLVQQAIDKLMENRTVLVIAHRLSTITHADKIVVFNQGKIAGLGAHKELLESCPIYKTFYENQLLTK
jgi:subfamily B ATP-binding cassette protein MsbA